MSENVAAKQRRPARREDRIRYYEALMHETEQGLSEFEGALERFTAVQEKLKELNDYYGSKSWRGDFEASEKGRLPAGLPCGVLSEDGVWNLLERSRDLIDESLERLGKYGWASEE